MGGGASGALGFFRLLTTFVSAVCPQAELLGVLSTSLARKLQLYKSSGSCSFVRSCSRPLLVPLEQEQQPAELTASPTDLERFPPVRLVSSSAPPDQTKHAPSNMNNQPIYGAIPPTQTGAYVPADPNSLAPQNGTRDGKRFKLVVEQQPVRARMCGFGDKVRPRRKNDTTTPQAPR